MSSEATLEGKTGHSARNTALLGLILVSIAPSISVTTGYVFKAGILSVFVFIFTKLWIFGLPGFWYLKIEKQAFSWSPAKKGGWGMSLLLGAGMMIVVWLAYFLLGEQMLQPNVLISILDPVGLTTPWKFAAAIVFWVFINSVLEEYVFRWFITSKVEEFFDGKWRSTFISSAIFTLHHSIALFVFLDPVGAFLASLGVFIGGSIFSWLYLEYRSIWVAWVAHACADVAIFAIAWDIVIGF
ncbi:MAG: CPBP family intramembrane metalloprotease [Candidatus Poseidoniales archaeon]|nr:MAG: CPBP family intramembrane metalloprotease [Candidatus Poseidoniales archaeon]